MIKVEYLGDNQWKVLEGIGFQGVEVPEGFIYDGASAPRFLWWVLPPMQDTAFAACIHDKMCREAKDHKDRRKADRYFLAALLTSSKLNIFRCIAGYLGVRIGAMCGVGVYYV